MNDILLRLSLPNETATLSLGTKIAHICFNNNKNNLINTNKIWLTGPLGTGKTTFCRGFLYGLGYKNKVKSPTYLLVNSYYISKLIIHHFDFYQLSNSSELEYIGIRDYFFCQKNQFYLIEWPEKCYDILPVADIEVRLDYYNLKTYNAEIYGISENGKKTIKSYLSKNRTLIIP
ncbi:MAG: tRNA (adenosine(37)-N6)-threonylcarbamoyltransferase complex ATPase subunit type 1 TsaE [Candidatus Dasytiphilus stammeri]